MKKQIQTQINSIDESLAWLRAYRPEQYDARFLDLVEERRRLRRIAEAMREKPAIAAFGESQKGKSYLISNLLQKDKKSFTVTSGADGSEVNFVMNINPIGDKKEATGVVTRFTSFSENDNRYSQKYPVIIKLFTVANLITILADSYYSDILDYRSYSESETAAFSEELLSRYSDRPELSDAPLTEDDVLEIKAYLAKFAQAATQNLRRSGYFENLARIARRIPASELCDAVGYLWHRNPVVSALFRRLSGALEKLGFPREVYTTLEAARHYGDNRNTFMSVDCLNELDLDHPARLTDIHIRRDDGFRTVQGVAKCELCALCAETVFRIAPEFLTDSECYSYSGNAPGDLPSESACKLAPKVDKTLLRDMDLLDFPGARNRLKIKESFLSETEAEQGSSNAVQMLLRGKVAFLFNSYNDSRAINILLFCHDNEQPAVTDMYNMVDSWVNKYVGADPAKRKVTVDNLGGISPLFVIGTKFNVDMIEKDNPEHNSATSLHQRWDGRFMKVLYTQVFKGDSVKWFNNWTAPGETFKNTYMLRDFKYSGCTGSGNNLYEGYSETDADPSEKALKLTPSFYGALRDSFITNASVAKFFRDPALAWDTAATRNNDGALFIIDNLTRASRHAARTRELQFEEERRRAAKKVYSVMETFHVDENPDKMLTDNIRKAMTIIRELDFTSNSDNYFFGHLLQGMMMSEPELITTVHQLVTGPDLVDDITDWKEYEMIRSRCGGFSGCPDEASKWQRLIDTYYFRDRDDAASYLERRGVDPAILFKDSSRSKSNSSAMAERVIQEWHKKLSGHHFRNTFASDSGFDPTVLSDLTAQVEALSRELGLADAMSEAVAEYVNIVNVANANESLVADILSAKICDFVRDLGYSMLPERRIESARRIASERSLPAFSYIDRPRKSDYTEEELSGLFDELNSGGAEMPAAFTFSYNRWLEYLVVSYIARDEIPSFNRAANAELGTILTEISNIS